MTELYAGKPSAELYDYLTRRRSAKKLSAPGPDREQISRIIAAASRVPDHGKLFPWYFVVFSGAARAEAGKLIAQAWQQVEPDASPAKLELESERLMRAPASIMVVSKMREGKITAWEQILSGGASCMTLCLAANALGFATNWLSEWYVYHPAFKSALGLGDNEHIAGLIQIGTPVEPPEERPRPDPAALTSWWQPGMALNKGPDYGHPGKGFTTAGFKLTGFRED